MRNIFLVCVFGLQSISAIAAERQVYVTAATAKVKADAKPAAAEVFTVSRGDELTLVSESGNWMEIKKGESKGWISKLFVSAQKPIGKNEVLKQEAVTDEKLSRKRSADYSVSAATRGLSASERNAKGEQFRSNQQALEKLEKDQASPAEVEKFEQQAKPGN